MRIIQAIPAEKQHTRIKAEADKAHRAYPSSDGLTHLAKSAF